MPARHLEWFDSQHPSRSASAVVTRDHAVLSAEDVSRAGRRPLVQRRDFLGQAPELPAQVGCRIPGDLRIAIVIENLDCARLGPGGASVGMADGRYRGAESSPEFGLLRIEAEAWHGHQGAEVNGHQGRRHHGRDGNRQTAQRVADQDDFCGPVWNGLDHEARAAFGAGVRVLAGKIDRAGRMAVPLELLAQQVPAPGTVIRAMDEGEVHARRLEDALQHDGRDLARGSLAVVVEGRVDVGMMRVQALVLFALRNVRASLELLLPYLHGHLRVLHEVVVPGRVSGRAALGGDDHVVVAVAGVDERVLAYLPGFGAYGREDQDIPSEGGAGGGLSVGPEVLDQVAVEVLKACTHHGFQTHRTGLPIPRPDSMWLWQRRRTSAPTSTPSSSKPPRTSSSTSSSR